MKWFSLSGSTHMQYILLIVKLQIDQDRYFRFTFGPHNIFFTKRMWKDNRRFNNFKSMRQKMHFYCYPKDILAWKAREGEMIWCWEISGKRPIEDRERESKMGEQDGCGWVGDPHMDNNKEWETLGEKYIHKYKFDIFLWATLWVVGWGKRWRARKKERQKRCWKQRSGGQAGGQAGGRANQPARGDRREGSEGRGLSLGTASQRLVWCSWGWILPWQHNRGWERGKEYGGQVNRWLTDGETSWSVD